GVVRSQAVPLLAFDHAVTQEGAACGVDIHAVRGLSVEHETIARLAAQLVRVAARVEEYRAIALCHLRDRETRRRADLADDRDDLVALDQPLGLGRRRLRVDAVLR